MVLKGVWLRACPQELLGTNIAANLQLVVQVAKEYTEQLGAGKIIEMLEAHKSYHGLYYYLGGHIAFSEDPEARRCAEPYCIQSIHKIAGFGTRISIPQGRSAFFC